MKSYLFALLMMGLLVPSVWASAEAEFLASLPQKVQRMKAEGDQLLKQGRNKEAAEKYGSAAYAFKQTADSSDPLYGKVSNYFAYLQDQALGVARKTINAEDVPKPDNSEARQQAQLMNYDAPADAEPEEPAYV